MGLCTVDHEHSADVPVLEQRRRAQRSNIGAMVIVQGVRASTWSGDANGLLAREQSRKYSVLGAERARSDAVPVTGDLLNPKHLTFAVDAEQESGIQAEAAAQ